MLLLKWPNQFLNVNRNDLSTSGLLKPARSIASQTLSSWRHELSHNKILKLFCTFSASFDFSQMCETHFSSLHKNLLVLNSEFTDYLLCSAFCWCKFFWTLRSKSCVSFNSHFIVSNVEINIFIFCMQITEWSFVSQTINLFKCAQTLLDLRFRVLLQQGHFVLSSPRSSEILAQTLNELFEVTYLLTNYCLKQIFI